MVIIRGLRRANGRRIGSATGVAKAVQPEPQGPLAAPDRAAGQGLRQAAAPDLGLHGRLRARDPVADAHDPQRRVRQARRPQSGRQQGRGLVAVVHGLDGHELHARAERAAAAAGDRHVQGAVLPHVDRVRARAAGSTTARTACPSSGPAASRRRTSPAWSRAPRRARPGRASLYGHGLLGDAEEATKGTHVHLMANEHDITFCATDWSGFSSKDLPNTIGHPRRPLGLPRDGRPDPAGLPELPLPGAADAPSAGPGRPTRRSRSPGGRRSARRRSTTTATRRAGSWAARSPQWRPTTGGRRWACRG